MYSYGTCTARSKLKRARVFWSSSSNPLVQFPPLVFMDQSLTRGQTQPNLLNQPCWTTYQHSLVITTFLDKISTPPYQYSLVGQNINTVLSLPPFWTKYLHKSCQYILNGQNINTALDTCFYVSYSDTGITELAILANKLFQGL